MHSCTWAHDLQFITIVILTLRAHCFHDYIYTFTKYEKIITNYLLL